MEKNSSFRKPLSSEEIDTYQKALDKDFAKYEVMKQNFEGFKAQREQEFEDKLDSLLSDQERDIVEVGGNAAETYKILKKHEKIYVDDAVEKEKKVLDSFKDKLYENQGKIDAMSIETKYANENPDTDFEGLVNYIQTDLTPKQLDALHEKAGGNQEKFLRLAAEQYAQAQNSKKKEKADLPTDLGSVAGATGDIDNNDGLSDEDDSYAKQAGLYR